VRRDRLTYRPSALGRSTKPKAVIIARGYLELDGIDIVCVPSFVEIMIDDQERTAVRLSVEKRSVDLGEAPPSGVSATEEGTGYEL
jgi:hypothetical protein